MIAVAWLTHCYVRHIISGNDHAKARRPLFGGVNHCRMGVWEFDSGTWSDPGGEYIHSFGVLYNYLKGVGSLAFINYARSEHIPLTDDCASFIAID